MRTIKLTSFFDGKTFLIFSNFLRFLAFMSRKNLIWNCYNTDKLSLPTQKCLKVYRGVKFIYNRGGRSNRGSTVYVQLIFILNCHTPILNLTFCFIFSGASVRVSSSEEMLFLATVVQVLSLVRPNPDKWAKQGQAPDCLRLIWCKQKL